MKSGLVALLSVPVLLLLWGSERVDAATTAPPASIRVPAGDADGAYTVKWKASPTVGASYILQEATNSTFTAGLRTFRASRLLQRTIAGRTMRRTYYYRVKARHVGKKDSPWQVGANGCAVPGRSAAILHIHMGCILRF